MQLISLTVLRYVTMLHTHTHTHTHTFNGPSSTRVSRYQKGKPIWILLKQEDSEWQWHQLGHMQVCTLLQTDNHDATPPLSFYRAMLSIRGTSHGPVSVHLSVTSRCSIESDERIELVFGM